jgi:hypothetical protein
LLVDEPGEAGLDPPSRAIQQRVREIDEQHGETRLCEDLGDAFAHGARTNHADSPDHVILRSASAALLAHRIR